jgi:FdhE protein
MSAPLAEIARRHPEWRDWLAQAGELLDELGNPAWDVQVPRLGEAREGVPLAITAGIDPAQAPMPLLHACRRRWSDALPKAWSRGDCPVCGAWPAFAETCGVERARYLRCVRCGAAWRVHGLSCPFCANRDHATLGSLVPEDGAPRDGPPWAIEVCRRCRGYLKVFTVLQPAAPEALLVQDLKTVELDVAAESRGYARPQGPADGARVAA